MSKAKRLSPQFREDLLRRYRDRLEMSKRWRRKEQMDKLWEQLTDLYRGKHYLESLNLMGEDRIAVNLVFATINVIVPSVSVRYPKMVVFSQKNEDSQKAVVVEQVLNYWWGHYDFQDELALAVKDWLVVGHGWLKVGWRFVEEAKQVTAAETAADEDESHPDADAPLTPEAPTKPGDEPDDAETDADPDMEVTQDRPFVERVSFHDIFVDPEAKTLAAASWIAQRSVRALAEVKQDKRYRLKGRQCLKADGHIPNDWRPQDSPKDIGDDLQRVTIWEFYDLRLNTMCVFSELGDELLLDPIPQPYAFGHPFVMLRNYDVPDKFYPMGEVEAIEPLQHELNRTRSDLMNQRKRYSPKYIYRDGVFDNSGIDDLESDRPNVMVAVVRDDVPLNDAVVPLPINNVDPQLFQYMGGIQQDMNQVSGLNEYQSGEQQNVRRTATEASMIGDTANSRAQDKLTQVEKSIAKVASRVIQLAQQYMTQDTEVRVMGPHGFPLWVPFTPQAVQGEFDFSVEAGSTQPLNEHQRRTDALQMLQTMTPYASAGLVNAQELLKYALRYGFGIQQPDRFLMGAAPQQPGEAQKAPKQSIVETMNYANTPPDIQRQMEQAAGFTPSQTGGSSPGEQAMASAVPAMAGQQAQATNQQGAQQAQLEQLQAKHAHEASMLHEKNRHEFAMAQQGHGHKVLQSAVDHSEGLQQGQQQAAQAGQAADQQAGNDQMQQMMGAALQGAQGPPGASGASPSAGPSAPSAGPPETTADTEE